MKRSMIAALVAVLLSTAILGTGIYLVNREKEAVVIREEVIAGDRSGANGLTFKVSSRWEQNLLWETWVTLEETEEREDSEATEERKDSETAEEREDSEAMKDSEAAEESDVLQEVKATSVFSFYPDGIFYEIPEEGDLDIYLNTNFSYSSNGELLSEGADTPYREIFVDVASRAEEEIEYSEEIAMGEYCPYYELETGYHEPDFLAGYTWLVTEESWSGMEESPLDAALTEAVKLRIPEDQVMKATVFVGPNGGVYHLRCEVQEKIRLIYDTAMCKDGFYVALSVVDEEGNFLEGGSETGYGIYRIPVAVDEAEKTYEPKLGEIQLVHPMNGETLGLEINDSREELFFLCSREQQLYLQVLDLKNCTLKQELYLGENSGYESSVYNREIVLKADDRGVLVMGNGGQTYYIEETDTGYELAVSYNLGKVDRLQMIRGETYAYDYKDGRLAMIFCEGYYRGSNVYVVILSGEELEFLGYYDHSLNRDMSMSPGNTEVPCEIRLP